MSLNYESEPAIPLQEKTQKTLVAAICRWDEISKFLVWRQVLSGFAHVYSSSLILDCLY